MESPEGTPSNALSRDSKRDGYSGLLSGVYRHAKNSLGGNPLYSRVHPLSRTLVPGQWFELSLMKCSQNCYSSLTSWWFLSHREMRFQVLTHSLVTPALACHPMIICPDVAGPAGRPTYVCILGWVWLGSIGKGIANMHLLPGPNPRPGWRMGAPDHDRLYNIWLLRSTTDEITCVVSTQRTIEVNMSNPRGVWTVLSHYLQTTQW